MDQDTLSCTVFLTSTDTAIGFLSQDATKLDRIKHRPPHKRYIKAVASLRYLCEHVRIPNAHKNRVRRSKQTTFIYPNGDSYRVVFDSCHAQLLHKLGGWAYTTSANKSSQPYEQSWAIKQADITIFPLIERPPSRIYRLGKRGIVPVRT